MIVAYLPSLGDADALERIGRAVLGNALASLVAADRRTDYRHIVDNYISRARLGRGRELPQSESNRYNCEIYYKPSMKAPQ
jgi:hypothetical protein